MKNIFFVLSIFFTGILMQGCAFVDPFLSSRSEETIGKSSEVPEQIPAKIQPSQTSIIKQDWKGWIIFVSDHDGDPDLYLLSPDMEETIRIGVSILEPQFPAWSHDYKKIAFIGEFESERSLYTLDLNCLNNQTLCIEQVLKVTSEIRIFSSSIAWLPGDQQIALQTREGDPIMGAIRLVKIDIDTKTIEYLTDLNTQYPSFSPDGSQMILTSFPVSGEMGPSEGFLLLCFVETGVCNNFFSDKVDLRDSFQADWSPTRDEIIFMSSIGDQFEGSFFTELYIADIDGKNSKRLDRRGESPSWSPSGNQFIYMGEGGLYLADREGISSKMIFPKDGIIQNFQAEWSP